MNLRPLAILYVDDDADIRTIVEMALGLDPTLTLRLAASGAEALALVDTGWQPNVVVLDVMMPGMDGPQTLAALRHHPALATVPAVFMTARGGFGDVVRYRQLGAAGTIAKPFDPLGLATEIRTLIGKA